MLLVVDRDAVVDPRAVVVHANYTALARTAMVSCVRLDNLAPLAHSRHLGQHLV
jgi:hypothetical protein